MLQTWLANPASVNGTARALRHHVYDLLDGFVHRLLCFPHSYFLSDDTGVVDSSQCSAPPVTRRLRLSWTNMPIKLAPQVVIRANGVVRVCGRGEELEPAVGARPHRGNFAHGSHDDEAALGHGGNTLAQAPLGAYGPVGLLHTEKAHSLEAYNSRRCEIVRSDCVSSRGR
jgi:hypothetical protein